MPTILQRFGAQVAAVAVIALMPRVLSALAVGLVAAAHELHPQSAMAEAERRSKF